MITASHGSLNDKSRTHFRTEETYTNAKALLTASRKRVCAVGTTVVPLPRCLLPPKLAHAFTQLESSDSKHIWQNFIIGVMLPLSYRAWCDSSSSGSSNVCSRQGSDH